MINVLIQKQNQAAARAIASPDNDSALQQHLRDDTVVVEVEDHASWYCMTFHPHSRGRGVWDLVVLFLLLYCAATIPFRIAFEVWPPDGTVEFVWETLVDVCFWIDIVVNFRTAVYVNGKLRKSFKVIAFQYLKLWFWIDFFSVLPFADIIGAVLGGNTEELRLTRTIRICRVVRVVRMMRLFDRWSKHIYINKSISRSFKFLLTLLFLAHIMACFWFWASSLGNNHGPSSWVYDYFTQGRGMETHPHDWKKDGNQHMKSVWNWYFVALYWAIMTVTTVGYGDLSPSNDFERVMAALSMLVGGVTYAYVVGNIAVLVQNFDPSQKEYDNRITAVNNYMALRSFPRQLQFKIREHYDFCFRAKLMLSDEEMIYTDLSEELKAEMLEFLNYSMLSPIKIFEDITVEFVREIPNYLPDFKVVALRSCAAGTVLLKEGSPVNSLFYVKRGQVSVRQHGEVVSSIHSGSFFGEVAFFDEPYTSPCSYVATANCEFYEVPKDLVMLICEHFGSVNSQLRQIAQARALQLAVGTMSNVGGLLPGKTDASHHNNTKAHTTNNSVINTTNHSKANTTNNSKATSPINTPTTTAPPTPKHKNANANTSRTTSKKNTPTPTAPTTPKHQNANANHSRNTSKKTTPTNATTPVVSPRKKEGSNKNDSSNTAPPRLSHSPSPSKTKPDTTALAARVSALRKTLLEQRGELEILASMLEYSVVNGYIGPSNMSTSPRVTPLPPVHGHSARCLRGECFHVV